MGTYCESKSAVARLTEPTVAELREKHINMNCVLPSIINTPENRKDMPSADPSRWVSPDQLVNVIAFPVSPQASAIHGSSLLISGLSCTRPPRPARHPFPDHSATDSIALGKARKIMLEIHRIGENEVGSSRRFDMEAIIGRTRSRYRCHAGLAPSADRRDRRSSKFS